MDDLKNREVEANIDKLNAEKKKLATETQSIAYRDMLETIKVMILALGVGVTLVVGVTRLLSGL